MASRPPSVCYVTYLQLEWFCAESISSTVVPRICQPNPQIVSWVIAIVIQIDHGPSFVTIPNHYPTIYTKPAARIIAPAFWAYRGDIAVMATWVVYHLDRYTSLRDDGGVRQ